MKGFLLTIFIILLALFIGKTTIDGASVHIDRPWFTVAVIVILLYVLFSDDNNNLENESR